MVTPRASPGAACSVPHRLQTWKSFQALSLFPLLVLKQTNPQPSELPLPRAPSSPMLPFLTWAHRCQPGACGVCSGHCPSSHRPLGAMALQTLPCCSLLCQRGENTGTRAPGCCQNAGELGSETGSWLGAGLQGGCGAQHLALPWGWRWGGFGDPRMAPKPVHGCSWSVATRNLGLLSRLAPC